MPVKEPNPPALEGNDPGTPGDFSGAVQAPGALRQQVQRDLLARAAAIAEIKQASAGDPHARPAEILPVPEKKKRKRSPMKGKKLATLPQRKLIVDLKVAGKSDADIADEVGLKPATVRYHLAQWVAANTPSEEATEGLRVLMDERLERLHDRWWNVAMGELRADGTWERPPSKDAGEFVLKILDRKAKLRGLDVTPSQTTLLISAESIAAYLGWDPQEGKSAVPADYTYEEASPEVLQIEDSGEAA